MLPDSLPSDISQKRFTKALQKVGFIINYSGGKGGHYKATCPRTKKFLTIQSKLYKHVLKDKLKQVEEWGYNASDIMDKY